MLRDKNGNRKISIRLGEKCTHPPERRTKQKCGHDWCPRCQGYVHPVTNIAQIGPGPIIDCNRRRQPEADCETLFGEYIAEGNEGLPSEALKHYPNNKVRPKRVLGAPPANIKAGKFVIKTREGYDKVKQQVKSRDCWYEHFEPSTPFIPYTTT